MPFIPFIPNDVNQSNYSCTDDLFIEVIATLVSPSPSIEFEVAVKKFTAIFPWHNRFLSTVSFQMHSLPSFVALIIGI